MDMRGLVIKFPCSRGDSGALYPQSATEGVMAGFGLSSCEAAHGKWRWCFGLARQESMNRVRSGTKQH